MRAGLDQQAARFNYRCHPFLVPSVSKHFSSHPPSRKSWALPSSTGAVSTC
ncbi:MAG: hypothetical protein KTR25_17190 [Myxococcales bacterium]|nr:hypothetical protein [Myxococcales bacterium]